MTAIDALSETTWPFYHEDRHEEILGMMTACGLWGVIPEGMEGVEHPNPFAFEVIPSDASSKDSRGEEELDGVANEEAPKGDEMVEPPPMAKKCGKALAAE